MEYKDYYKILGVDKRASEREIKQAYRKLARQHHPDMNPGDKQAEEKFKSINEAYEVLSDPEKRQRYNQLGTSYFRWQQQGGDPRGFDWSQWFSRQPGGGGTRVEYGDLGDIFGSGGFSDFFQSIFGGMGQPRSGRRRGQTKGSNYEQPVEINLEEAARGAQRVLTSNGNRITVKIPVGVKTGSKVRVAGKGGPGIGGGPPGDLYLAITVAQHSAFERKGNDLHCEVPIDLYTAVLGGEAEVPTLDGKVRLKIPAGTQGGKTFRLKGKGMPHLSDTTRHGDLYAKVRITVPRKLGRKERTLFEELAAMGKQ